MSEWVETEIFGNNDADNYVCFLIGSYQCVYVASLAKVMDSIIGAPQ